MLDPLAALVQMQQMVEILQSEAHLQLVVVDLGVAVAETLLQPLEEIQLLDLMEDLEAQQLAVTVLVVAVEQELLAMVQLAEMQATMIMGVEE
jgi:hypothetical protein